MSTPPADRWGLRTLMTQTLDPAYAEAAGRGRPRPARFRAMLMVVIALAGVVLGVAIRQQQHQATDRQATRAALIERIDERNGEVGNLMGQLQALRGEIAALQDAALGSSEQGSALLAKLRAQELAAGLTEVSGPGITITVANPTPSAGNDPVGHGQTVDQDGMITDVDLQRAVNALWASGAEAIAINGERIGPVTAIRQAGGAVLIDFKPTASPYVIEVIGNPATLPAEFAATEPARRFSTYRAAYGAEYEVQTSDTLTLPAATDPAVAGNATGSD